ncbi:MAG: nitrilase family protein [Prevotellaceae bacterium]|jgi:predicted amidohydrolase|nr:nitrilase family protein [Prevotellaceae bacterium]
MDILLLQTDIEWQSPDNNRKRIRNILNLYPCADIIILPEMFTTGFCISPVNVAEKADTDTLAWMQNLAGDRNSAIAGSIAVEDGGKYYNRFYFVKPDGSYSVYNKRHLFSFVGEDREYTAGDKRVIVEYGGFRILLQVCYDIRFPVFSRNRGDYDMIIYVANWPFSRIGAWTALLPARAIENQCYVAGVNRAGSDPATKYSGGTALIDFLGQPAVVAGFDKEEAVLGTVNIKSLNAFRKKFPALADADKFVLE